MRSKGTGVTLASRLTGPRPGWAKASAEIERKREKERVRLMGDMLSQRKRGRLSGREDGVDGEGSAEEEGDLLAGFVGDGAPVGGGDFDFNALRIDHPKLS